MKHIFLSIWVILIISCSSGNKKEGGIFNKKENESLNDTGSFGQNKVDPKQKTITRNYSKLLDSSMLKLKRKEKLNAELIELCIPLSNEEFSIFYSFTNKKPNILFYDLDKLMYLNAKNNYGNSFVLYLDMSEFVDGEYAESYFGHFDYLVKTKKDLLSKVYSKLSKTAQTKLIKEDDSDQ